MILSKGTRDYALIDKDTIKIEDYCFPHENNDIPDLPVARGEYRLSYYKGKDFEQEDIDLLKDLYAEADEKFNDATLEKELQNMRNTIYCVEIQLKGKCFRHNSPRWEYIGEISSEFSTVGFYWGGELLESRGGTFTITTIQGTKLYGNEGYYASLGDEDVDDYYDVFGIKENGKYIALIICTHETIPPHFKNKFSHKLDHEYT